MNPGKLQAENLRHARAASNGGKHAERLKPEGLERLAPHFRHDIGCQGGGLASCVLRGRGTKLARIQDVRHGYAIAKRPHAGPLRHLQAGVHQHPILMFGARQRGENGDGVMPAVQTTSRVAIFVPSLSVNSLPLYRQPRFQPNSTPRRLNCSGRTPETFA